MMEKAKVVNFYKCDVPMCNVMENTNMVVRFKYFFVGELFKSSTKVASVV
jgi:hypothetical protein